MSSTTSEEAKKTFHGSCHCKFITYTVSVPQSQLDNPRAGRCNCTICLKAGYTNVRIARTDFKLLTPASLAECKDYRIRPEQNIHKYFCGTCGIHVAQEGSFEWNGQVHEFFTFNLVTLEQPQDGLELSQWKFTYCDGRNDKFENISHDGPLPGGVL
ncbi:hypothetical protein H2200_013091 [Cladophialophora chaetospira]|uniref:CENP-V/GFA domain-containing protein n=1 Tax=Cladophialophora chaetospira TaxID=386627 RepID=A0AA38WWP6_9EURO|nr:hypothetical protein H2200_013091 [Cladophialophora chaetospira]